MPIREYISVTLSKPDYYYKAARGNGKSFGDLYCFIKVILPMLSTTQPYVLYISEYKAHDFKLNLENLYKEMIFNKVLNLYLANNKSNQRNNTQEEINFFKLIATKDNTIRKIYK